MFYYNLLYCIKMFKFDYITKEDKREHNLN